MTTDDGPIGQHEAQARRVAAALRSWLDVGATTNELYEAVDEAVEAVLAPTSPLRFYALAARARLAEARGTPVPDDDGYQASHAA